MKLKSKTFVPFPNKIVVEPIKAETFLQVENNYEEMGKVISVGKGVTFVKPGDTIFFRAFGCDKTPEVDGKVYYVVEVSPQFILGKYGKK